MNKIIILYSFLIPFISNAQIYKKVTKQTDKVSIELYNGVLTITPLTENAARIRFGDGKNSENQELIFVNKLPVPDFSVNETDKEIEVLIKYIKVVFDKKTGNLTYFDKAGKSLLKEVENSRKYTPSSLSGESCFIAEQQFESPADECIYGLGQFQDGQLNLKGISRKLTQVNTQISIPFIYSSKGYGLLWHQYGLTEFNPTDNSILLEKKVQDNNQNVVAEVTTSAGTQKVEQSQAGFSGKFSVRETAIYTMMLDLGDMDNRHLLIIDGTPIIDQSNYWLPPTQSTKIELKSGEHSVQVVCKSSNNPKVTWQKTENINTFRSPNAKELDYVVFCGENADKIIETYRNLSGNVPMLPLWAYGFWQCRERYTSSQHLIETVKEFRNRKLPMDVIVQDWQYWGKYGWGAMKFDETYYPDPKLLCNELHKLNARFSLSVWENVDKKSEVGKNYIANKLYIENSPWIDITNPATRKAHWDALNSNLFSTGVDSWWADATEPENDALRNTKTYLGNGSFYRLTYPLFVSQAVYEGQRKTTSEKRVCILTRSAFAGQQRYGTINWSGDINGTWDGFRRQIIAGLGYCITGMPFYTTDIGGFFRPGASQFTDEKYHELLTRWFQYGVFNPIFRIHGYETETEIWKYGNKFEKNARLMLDLRYRLLPYIYSESWQVTKNGSTIMRPLVMDFQEDKLALNQKYEYMFGKSFLVAPITEERVQNWNVYLPKTANWFDFWTGKQINGGQTVSVETSLEKIPLYVKAGSIVPMGKLLQFSGEKKQDTLEIRIYRGTDAQFELYEDEGDNYNYEKGEFSTILFEWNNAKQVLTIGDRKGKFAGVLKERVFKIVFVTENLGNGIYIGDKFKMKKYSGKKTMVKE
ncbi:MAG: TIM-barrel domain-containing protein [Flavobacterium sp.]